MRRRNFLASAAAVSFAQGGDKRLLMPTDQPDEHHFKLMWYNPVPPIDETTWRLQVKGLVENPQSLQLAELRKLPYEEQSSRIGNQTGGRVFLFLHTDDFWRDYERMKTKGVTFCETPREEIYGMVVVFKDLYGNKWDLLQLKTP